ncbi:TlpA family protein disulfide reductase [Elusimicrobiota bacterium]
MKLKKLLKMNCKIFYLPFFFISFCVSIVSAEILIDAPDFTLKDLDSNEITLSDYEGKVVFLDFWASWCPPCRMSIPVVEELYEKFKDEDVVFFGINMESDVNKVSGFVQANDMKYKILMRDQKVGRHYGIRGIPAFFIINQDGQIVDKYVGYDPSMSKIWEEKIQSLLDASSPAKKKAKK